MGGWEQEARVVLIEGLPGAGKTTLAEQLARERGASWAREEATDHPVLPASVRARNGDDDFDALCLARWRAFEEIVARHTEQLIVLAPDKDRMRKAFAERGDEWRRKVSAWIASTPRGGGLDEFWFGYAALCDDLIATSTLPVLRV